MYAGMQVVSDTQVTERKVNPQCGAATSTEALVWNMIGRGDVIIGWGEFVAVNFSWMSIVDCNVASTDPWVLYILVNKRVHYNFGFATVHTNTAR